MFISLLTKLQCVHKLFWLNYSFRTYSEIMTRFFFTPSQINEFCFEQTIYIINKLKIIIWYHINLFTNLYNLISSLYKYIFIQVCVCVCCIYIVKSSFMFTNRLLCFRLAHLIVESKFRLEFGLFAKQIINKFFTSWA